MNSTTFAAAYGADWAIGDPETWPHPVRWIGNAIAAGERSLRGEFSSERPACRDLLGGAILAGCVVSGVWLAAGALVESGGAPVEIALGWSALATRNLLDAAGQVLAALDDENTPAARERLGQIVGRDTAHLDETEILRAVIETLAESLCDGVIAPLLYLGLGGAKWALAYKAVNTLDSMIGHRTPEYLHFGRAAARLDDAANFLPARVTVGAIAAAAQLIGCQGSAALAVCRRDGALHASPNAGRCEAAMAGALGVQLGGTNTYDGIAIATPRLGEPGRPPQRDDARKARCIVGVASLLVFGALWLGLRWREARES